MNCCYGNVKVASNRRRSRNNEVVLGLKSGLGLDLGLCFVLK